MRSSQHPRRPISAAPAATSNTINRGGESPADDTRQHNSRAYAESPDSECRA